MMSIPEVSSGLSELILAIQQGDLDRASNLIGNDPLPEGGYSLLRTAVECNQSEIAKLLMSKGANVNDDLENRTNTPLHFGVMNRDIEIVKTLLSHMANVDAEGEDGKTVLYIAVEQGDKLMIQKILAHHPDIDNDSNKDSLKIAVERCQKSSIDIVESLVRYGFTLHPKDARYSKLMRVVIANMCPKTVQILFEFACELGSRCDPITLMDVRNRLKGIVKKLWKRDYYVNETYKWPTTVFDDELPLCSAENIAVRESIMTFLRRLLHRGSDVNAKTGTTLTVLYLTILNEDKDILRIVAENCDPNMRCGGSMILHSYAEAGEADNCRLLIRRGADVNAMGERGFTALHLAARRNCVDVTQILLDNGADINQTNESGFTALHLATIWQAKNTMRILLSRGADVNVRGRNDVTALHLDAQEGSTDTCSLLINSGADVNTRTAYGLTAFHIATIFSNSSVVRILLDTGVDVDTRDETGYSALPLTTISGKLCLTLRGIEDCANLDFDFNVDSETLASGSGFTALHIAVRYQNKYIVEILLERGADANARNRSGMTPLHLAAVKGLKEVSKSLIEKGADVNAKTSYGMTALHLAALFDRPCTVKLLLDSGADIDSVDQNGNTPLHLAILARRKRMPLILIKNGAAINVVNKFGQRAFDLNDDPDYVNSPFLFSHDNNSPCLGKEHKYYIYTMWLSTYGPFHKCKDTYCANIYSRCDSVDEYLTKMRIASSDVASSDVASSDVASSDVANSDVASLDVASSDGDYKNWRYNSTYMYLKKQSVNEQSRFNEKCKEEIRAMKRKIENTDASFYDVLTKRVRRLASYARNEHIVQAMEQNTRQKFPEYRVILESRFKRGVERNELLKEGDKYLERCFGSRYASLPLNCKEVILDNFNNADLVVLKKRNAS